MSVPEKIKALARYVTWDDGTPVYDASGWALSAPQMRVMGVTVQDMRVHGQWAPFEQIAVWPPVPAE